MNNSSENKTTLKLTDNELHIMEQALAQYEEKLWLQKDEICQDLRTQEDKRNCFRLKRVQQKIRTASDLVSILPFKLFKMSQS
jgi:hypothetical protein